MSDDEKINILIVDDQPAKLLSLEAILGGLGENLIKANSARQALDLLLRHEIAVLLVDVCMPELDGFELAQVIREHPRYQRTAIIFISAVHLADADRIRGYGLGGVDYIPVPIVPEMLRAKVAVFVDLYRKTRQLERMNIELERRVGQRTAELEASTAKLRESEERLTLALESAGAAPWDWDLVTLDFVWPPRYRRLYGFSENCTPSLESWLLRIHPDDRERLRDQVGRLMTKNGDDRWAEEYRILHEEYGLRWISGRGCVVRNAAGEAIRLVGIDLDSTERMQADAERACLLDSEREARAAAEQANRLKDEFLATVSHELRSPLNTVHMWIQLVRSSNLDRARMSEAVDSIERGVSTLTHLINDLLDLNAITSGKLRVQPGMIHLQAAVELAIRNILPMAEARKISVHVNAPGTPLVISGDATRIQQVFGNLLDNSVKFTQAGGRIEINVEKQAAFARVTVSDNGRGIAPDFLPNVFDRFRQADSSITRRHGGLGLGLAIVKHIVELHGGVISAESQGEGLGASFCVRLPLLLDKTKLLLAGSDAADMRLDASRILVVDDDADMREVLARLLTESGAEVLAVESGAIALQQFPLWNPTLVISDISMPDMDGYSLMRELRKADQRPPAIALTAFSRAEDRISALEAGFDLHISKPVNPRELLCSTYSLLNRHRRHEKQLSPSPKNLRVLVVDDDPDSANSLAALMRISGHEARAAYCGGDAIRMAMEFSPDVVLCDLELPDLDGCEVAGRLRAAPELSGVLLIAATGRGLEKDRDRCRSAGFDHHLIKPIEHTALLELLGRRAGRRYATIIAK